MANLKFEILPQPDDETCGATCLHAMYNFMGEAVELPNLIAEIPKWETGGTLAVLLGLNSLKKGYEATVYTYNLHVFDPTWFNGEVNLLEKLELQLKYKFDPKIQWASQAYMRFLKMGGKIIYRELNEEFLKEYLERNQPILTGLNATYLYQCAREINNEYNDVKGSVMGHFVVLTGYDAEKKLVSISDPLLANPFLNQQYHVRVDRVINSIMLGILTYDANLLIIEKKG